MGRPNSETKRKKRRRQKLRQKATACIREQANHKSPLNNSEGELNDSVDSVAYNTTSSSLPCDYVSVTEDRSNSASLETHSQRSDCSGNSLVHTLPNSSKGDSVTNCTYVTDVGDQDLELLEMTIYDSYRQEDGAPYSYKYLLDCRKKLMRKLHSCKKEVSDLQKEKLEAQIVHKEEIKRIRQFYEVIALAKSRSGRIVRSGMGTSAAAGEIIQDMESMFNDHD